MKPNSPREKAVEFGWKRGMMGADVLVLLSIVTLAARGVPPVHADTEPGGTRKNLILAASARNPRNSEGDFINLKNGNVLFIYSHFTGGDRNDSAADLASRVSSDGGSHWSDRDEKEIDAKSDSAASVMSVSLLRLKDGRIALFYLARKSESDVRLMVRFSRDEAATWGEATACSNGTGFALASNGRAVQLKTGRIVVPAAWHERPLPASGFDRGAATCFYSDDNGATWRRGAGSVEAAANSHSGMQHPVIVELRDGRLMMLMSMHLRPLMRAYSADAGDTWSPAETTDLVSPVSPAAIKRIASTGDLLIVWNDQSHADAAIKNRRTPLTAAVSADEGKTWARRINLYADPDESYSNAAIDFVGDRVLLAHCTGDRKHGMDTTVITSFDVGWLYRSP